MLDIRRTAAIGVLLTLSLTVAACGEDTDAATDSEASAGDSNGTLRFGWAELTGYAHLNPSTGEVEGVYVDLMQDIADDMGMELELVEDSWPTLVLGIDAGKYDVSMAGITDERMTQVDFTDPIVQSDFTFAVKSDSSWEGIEDLDASGNTIGVTTGSNTDEALTKIVENAEVLRVRDVGGVLLAVNGGTADAMAGVRDYLTTSIAGTDMKVLDSAWGVSTQGIFVGKGNTELHEEMQTEVARLLEDGVVADAIERYDLVGVEVSSPTAN
jgi:ABC-type amino acid transport substrate-binding protein